jgi:hypothetical protein
MGSGREWNTCLMITNDVASVVLFVNWLECFRAIWAGLETKETLLLVPQDSCLQKLFILRLLDTIGSQIVFFLNFYRNLPQYSCCSIRATDIKHIMTSLIKAITSVLKASTDIIPARPIRLAERKVITSDPDFISDTHLRQNVQFADKNNVCYPL